MQRYDEIIQMKLDHIKKTNETSEMPALYKMKMLEPKLPFMNKINEKLKEKRLQKTCQLKFEISQSRDDMTCYET